MIKLKKISALLIVLAFAAGCANNNEAEPRRYQEPRFTDQAPIDLKVNRVEVVSEFTPTFTRPNVEHLFPIQLKNRPSLGQRPSESRRLRLRQNCRIHH